MIDKLSDIKIKTIFLQKTKSRELKNKSRSWRDCTADGALALHRVYLGLTPSKEFPSMPKVTTEIKPVTTETEHPGATQNKTKKIRKQMIWGRKYL